MRDPAARLRFRQDHVARELTEPIGSDHFLRSALARAWMERGDLVPFELVDATTVQAPRVPFVSQPHEWCGLQLYRSAALTLQLQQEANAAGFDLKDASAWNVIFDGGRPVFCDLLSFEPLRQKRWRAAGQFARHFLLPLLVSRRRGLEVSRTFRAWRDGLPEEVARGILGPSRYFSRYWPLMAGGKPVAGGDEANHSRLGHPPALPDIQRHRESLNAALSWMLKGVEPKAMRDTQWGSYVEQRDHYSQQAVEVKRRQVGAWLVQHRPEVVLDLGCNSGEFSRLAADAGARVIAVDGDTGAIQRMCEVPVAGISAVLAPLDDLSGGRGWCGHEHPGLGERLQGAAEMTLVLALIHHLAIAASIPLSAIAEFLTGCTRRWLLVEFLSEDDVQVQALCRHYGRNAGEFSIDRQVQAFVRLGWRTLEDVPLPGGTRRLALLSRQA